MAGWHLVTSFVGIVIHPGARTVLNVMDTDLITEYIVCRVIPLSVFDVLFLYSYLRLILVY